MIVLHYNIQHYYFVSTYDPAGSLAQDQLVKSYLTGYSNQLNWVLGILSKK